MRKPLGFVLALAIIGAVVPAAAQAPTDEQRELRTRIEARYEVIPLSDGVALRPKSRNRDVRLIEISDGGIIVDGASVTGRELRERVGSDADLIVRLSYLDEDTRKALFSAAESPASPESAPPEESAPAAAPQPPEEPTPPRARRAHGDRVRVMGSVSVDRDELVEGQVVAVLGSVRIDGEVTDQVVAVLGSVDLGPTAVVRGDIVSVGGRVRRDPGAQVRGGITEVALGRGINVNAPGLHGWGPVPFFFGPLGGVARLIGSTFHLIVLGLLASIALLIARGTVERSAERISQEPLKATLVGIVSHILVVPVFVLGCILLAISIVGIPLLLLVPFAVLFLLLLALAGFSGAALTVGRATMRRFGWGADGAFAELLVGVVAILLLLLVGRLVGLAGWPASPFSFLLVAAGLGIEYLAWAAGFGAVLTNAFTRWQARRGSPPATPPAPQSATV